MWRPYGVIYVKMVKNGKMTKFVFGLKIFRNIRFLLGLWQKFLKRNSKNSGEVLPVFVFAIMSKEDGETMSRSHLRKKVGSVGKHPPPTR